MRSHHDAKAKTQRASQEDVALLDAEIPLAGEKSDNSIDTDDRRAKEAGWISLCQ